MKEISIPRWYQDLSIEQMQKVFALGDIMREDYVERVIGRTQRALNDIGITSTFVKINGKQIKKLRRLTDLDPVQFLCELYRIIAGQSFVDEEYKKFYDCNERIILSAIAFLTLPETLIELHRRIPVGKKPTFLQKPVPEKIPPRKSEKSPYLEPLFTRPDWMAYQKELYSWRKKCETIAIPKVILPSSIDGLFSNRKNSKILRNKQIDERQKYNLENCQQKRSDTTKDDTQKLKSTKIRAQDERQKEKCDKVREIIQRDKLISTVVETETDSFEKERNRDRSDHLKKFQFPDKSWLGEKVRRLNVAGVAEKNDSLDLSICYEMPEIVCVTPDNSNESFFTILNLPDCAKKKFPPGRENLSRKWQEWLRTEEEDFKRAEKEANKIIKSVEATLQLIEPKNICDSCCACRETRKANLKWHKTKTPHIVVDSVAMDGKNKRYIIGSLGMCSPAPSPSESTTDLPEIIPSYDKIVKDKVIGGITNVEGKATYCIHGVTRNVERVPRKVVSTSKLPVRIKNVPPCGCSIEKTINQNLKVVTSNDNIPWTKRDKMCIGQKYRAREIGAKSCQEYSRDKSCRKNSLMKIIHKEIKAAPIDQINLSYDDQSKDITDVLENEQPEDGKIEYRCTENREKEKIILPRKACKDKTGQALFTTTAREKQTKNYFKVSKSGDHEKKKFVTKKIHKESESKSKSRKSGKCKNKREKGNKERKREHDDEMKLRKDKTKQLKDQWNRTKRLANKFLDSRQFPIEVADNKRQSIDESAREGPFGWRTKSEQELPPEKTLVYLVEPDKSLETIPVRSGGRPCKCRENRNAKKKLLYSVNELVKDGNGKRNAKLSPVIDDLIYLTPTPSIRVSDEYVPEYEVYDSEHEKCTKRRQDNNLRYTERYLGPKSLMAKQKTQSLRCDCSVTKENAKELTAKNNSTAEKHSRAFHTEELNNFFSRYRDDIPCWVRCVEFSKDGRGTYPRNLRIVKPVCECKYERKIVKRDEEKKNWLLRQERLKKHKKPYTEISGLTIQDQVPKSGKYILSGIEMHSPITTPELSKSSLSLPKDHRHCFPTNIRTKSSLFTGPENIRMKNRKPLAQKNTTGKKTEKLFDAAFFRSGRTNIDCLVNENESDLIQQRVDCKESHKKKDEKGRKLNYVQSVMLQAHDSAMDQLVNVESQEKSVSEPPDANIHSRDKKSLTNIEFSKRSDLMNLAKIELKKMADEGFLFAKLPACHQMPQLQYWIMYRKGLTIPMEEKKKLMKRTFRIWYTVDKEKVRKIKAPQLEFPRNIEKHMNYDNAGEIMQEVKLKKAIFQSNVRKLRVLQARTMWSLMEFGKFPGFSFKQAYFTYQASKESHGFVFKPWQKS